MPIRAVFLEAEDSPCVYLAEQTALCEEFIVQEIDEELLSTLIENGYRHFGRFFFRPVCEHCHACIPIRVPTTAYHMPRSARRLLCRNADLDVRVAVPVPSREAFHLYAAHKGRFADAPELPPEPDYDRFVDSFFHPFPFSFVLEIRDGDRLVGVSHFDLTERVLSDIYCYYDLEYLPRSLGRFAIYKLLELAGTRGVPYVYLGFYIRDNAHMNYKRSIRPNELLLTEGLWTPFVDAGNQDVLSSACPLLGFMPRFRLAPAPERDSGDT